MVRSKVTATSPRKSPSADGSSAISGNGGKFWKKSGVWISFLIAVAVVFFVFGYSAGSGRRPSAPTPAPPTADRFSASTSRSQLPRDKALGSFLGFMVITAGTSENTKFFQKSLDFKLEVTAGTFAVNSFGRAVISSLEIKRSGGEHLFTLLNAELASNYAFSSDTNLNCQFRLDLLGTLDLFDKNQFVISIESWPLDATKGGCSVKFALN